jgi:hypothetical protein
MRSAFSSSKHSCLSRANMKRRPCAPWPSNIVSTKVCIAAKKSSLPCIAKVTLRYSQNAGSMTGIPCRRVLSHSAIAPFNKQGGVPQPRERGSTDIGFRVNVNSARFFLCFCLLESTGVLCSCTAVTIRKRLEPRDSELQRHSHGSTHGHRCMEKTDRTC